MGAILTTRSNKPSFIGKPKKAGIGQEGGSSGYRDWTAVFLNVEAGGGQCWPCTTVGDTKATFIFENDPLAVKINRLDFLIAPALYVNCTEDTCVLDAGQDDCIETTDEVNISIGIWHDNTITDAEIDRQTTILGGPWKTDLNQTNAFPGEITQFIKQPKDVDYTRFVYVTIRWDSASYYLPCALAGDLAQMLAIALPKFLNYQIERSL